MARIRHTDKKAKTLRAVRPNEGIAAAYRAQLDKLVREMQDSVIYWLQASYKANEPVIAQDELPATALKRTVRELSRRWQKRFSEGAPKLAKYFATDVQDRSDAALKKILKDAGFSVEFTMTAAQKDILRATIEQNVSLIRSIPQKYFTEVEGAVMRSVQTGRDLKQLTDDLQANYGVTRRRAAAIALSQNNMATSALNHARQQELGIVNAVWMHSHAGKHPRPTHVKMNGQTYEIAKGMYDPAAGKFIFPGTEINCRCTSRPVIPGFS